LKKRRAGPDPSFNPWSGIAKKVSQSVIPFTVGAPPPLHKTPTATDRQERFAPMQATTTASIVALRSELRRVTYGPLLPRLWHRARQEWLQAADRAAARAMRSIDHPGVLEDYQIAMHGRR
jgi:hypothetical protein